MTAFLLRRDFISFSSLIEASVSRNMALPISPRLSPHRIPIQKSPHRNIASMQCFSCFVPWAFFFEFLPSSCPRGLLLKAVFGVLRIRFFTTHSFPPPSPLYREHHPLRCFFRYFKFFLPIICAPSRVLVFFHQFF